jgi:hypothetical protein
MSHATGSMRGNGAAIYNSSCWYICVLMLLYMCPHATIYVSHTTGSVPGNGAAWAVPFVGGTSGTQISWSPGTQFTCFTSTKVQILTRTTGTQIYMGPRYSVYLLYQYKKVRGLMPEELRAASIPASTYFTYFTSTKALALLVQ